MTREYSLFSLRIKKIPKLISNNFAELLGRIWNIFKNYLKKKEKKEKS